MNDNLVPPTERIDGDLVVIQRNPKSGSGRRRRLLRELISALRQRQFAVRLFARRDRLDEFVNSQTSGRLRCLVAAGGDGTVSDLVNRHPGLPVATLPVATLPMGTENLVSRHLAIPSNGDAMAELIRTGCVKRYDTASIGSQSFLLMASVGVDAAVVERLHIARSGNISRWNYALPVLQSFLKYSFSEFCIQSLDDGSTVRGTHAVVSNFPEYGFRLKLTPDADPCDGLLDVCVFQGTTGFRSACHAVASLFRPQNGQKVIRFRAQHVRLEPTPPRDFSDTSSALLSRLALAVQTDGDPAGRLPVEIHVVPGAMTLIVRKDN